MKITALKKNQISNSIQPVTRNLKFKTKQHMFYVVCYFSTCGEKVWDKQEYCLDIMVTHKKKGK